MRLTTRRPSECPYCGSRESGHTGRETVRAADVMAGLLSQYMRDGSIPRIEVRAAIVGYRRARQMENNNV